MTPTVAEHTTEVVGIIHPPADIKVIIDKTANFVARNGPEFEQRILQAEGENPKFQFLHTSNPYHAYYQHKIKEVIEQDAQAAATTQEEQPRPEEEGEVEKVIEKPAEVLPKPKEKPKEDPAPEVYSVTIPQDITPFEMDLIKLTAQFVARNGRQFLSALAGRESRNPQFDFLKPQHRYFAFFTKLADIYGKIITPPDNVIESLRQDAQNKLRILDRCYLKAEWDQMEEEKKRTQEQQEDAERIEFQLIDWHDFVVVETIDFNDEEEIMPPAETQQEADMEMDVDMEDEAKEQPAVQEVPLEDEDEDITLKVRKDYVKPTKKPAVTVEKAEQFVKDPISGELIPLSKASEHMRIKLLDPRWKEQQEKEQAKFRTTALATNEELVATIGNFAKRRTDIFGEVEVDIGQSLDQDNVATKPDSAIWDGHTASIQATTAAAMQSVSVQDQIAAIHKNLADQKQVGPQLPSAAGATTSTPPAAPAAAANTAALAPGYRPPAPAGYPPVYIPPLPGQPYAGMPGIVPPPIPGAGIVPPAIPPPHPMMHQPPPPPPPAAAAAAEDEPTTKRMRMDQSHQESTAATAAGGATAPALIPEDQWAAQHPGNVSIVVQVPNVEEKKAEWGLDGVDKVITLDIMSKIGDVKDKLTQIMKLPQNKQVLRIKNGAFLKDEFSLAHYNLQTDSVLVLSLKERGGRKK